MGILVTRMCVPAYGPTHAIAAEALAAEIVKAAAPAAVAKRDFLNKVIFPLRLLPPALNPARG